MPEGEGDTLPRNPLAVLGMCRDLGAPLRILPAARRSRRNLFKSMGASTPFPSPAAIARAELFTRERFVYDGETLEDALAPGSARRRALDAALSELESDPGAPQPSIEWRRQ